MGWTDERVALLKKLWAEGHSASQIAKQIGGVTRNAVIGKVHRLGLAGRATPSRPAKRPARPRQQRSPLSMAPRVRPASSPYAPPVLTVVLDPLRFEDGSVATVLTLKEGMCKFPIG
ncbi:MAG: GcrA family cell cycle regulator, partial [Hyphomonadaceae bacterium]